jgi:hypothetical protein
MHDGAYALIGSNLAGDRFVSRGSERIAKRFADETRSSGNRNLHVASIRRICAWI